jgi:hypothetical protein
MKGSIGFVSLCLIAFSGHLFAKTKYLDVRLHSDAQSASNPPYANSTCTNISFQKVNSDLLRRYVIVPEKFINDSFPTPRIVDTDTNYLELSSHLRAALSEIGFQEASRAEEADIEISVSYGISSKSVYVSSGTTSMISGTISPSASKSTFSGTMTSKPTFTSSNKNPYMRIIKLTANPAYVRGKGNTCVWEMFAINDSKNNSIEDFRGIFPYMVEAMKPHIGKYREEYFFEVRIPVKM